MEELRSASPASSRTISPLRGGHPAKALAACGAGVIVQKGCLQAPAAWGAAGNVTASCSLAGLPAEPPPAAAGRAAGGAAGWVAEWSACRPVPGRTRQPGSLLPARCPWPLCMVAGRGSSARAACPADCCWARLRSRRPASAQTHYTGSTADVPAGSSLAAVYGLALVCMHRQAQHLRARCARLACMRCFNGKLGTTTSRPGWSCWGAPGWHAVGWHVAGQACHGQRQTGEVRQAGMGLVRHAVASGQPQVDGQVLKVLRVVNACRAGPGRQGRHIYPREKMPAKHQGRPSRSAGLEVPGRGARPGSGGAAATQGSPLALCRPCLLNVRRLLTDKHSARRASMQPAGQHFASPLRCGACVNCQVPGLSPPRWLTRVLPCPA